MLKHNFLHMAWGLHLSMKHIVAAGCCLNVHLYILAIHFIIQEALSLKTEWHLAVLCEVCVHWHSLPFVKHIFISSLFCWTLFLSCLSIPFNLMKSHCLLVIGNGTLPMNWTLTRVKCAASSHSLLSYQCSVSVTRQKYCIVILIFNTLTLNFESFALKLLV